MFKAIWNCDDFFSCCTRIEDAFDIFDHEQNKTVDVRELGTIIRSLGCYPNEAELQDMIQVRTHTGLCSMVIPLIF